MSLLKQVDVSMCQLVLRGAHKLWSSGKQVGGGADFYVCQFPCCKYSHQGWFQATSGLKFSLQNPRLSIHCLWQASTSWLKHTSARHDTQAGSRWPSWEPTKRATGPVTRRSRTLENDVKNTSTFSSLGCVASHALIEVLLRGHSAIPLPEGTSTLLFFRKYYLSPLHCDCTTWSPRKEQRPQRIPQTHCIFKLLKCQQELWFTVKRKIERRKGGNLI